MEREKESRLLRRRRPWSSNEASFSISRNEPPTERSSRRKRPLKCRGSGSERSGSSKQHAVTAAAAAEVRLPYAAQRGNNSVLRRAHKPTKSKPNRGLSFDEERRMLLGCGAVAALSVSAVFTIAKTPPSSRRRS